MARSRRKSGTPGSGEPRTEPDAPRAPAQEVAVEPRPHERVYAVVFGRVWLAALGAASATRRWSVASTDPVRGEILVEARALFGRKTRPVRVTVLLDEVGLTRVHASYLKDAAAAPGEGPEPRQLARFHRRLEALLRRDSRA